MPFHLCLPFQKKKKMKINCEQLQQKIIDSIRTIYDPEIPVNIYELGLIYAVDVDQDAKVKIDMTLTTPNCPEAQTLPARVEEVVKAVEGVTDVVVEIVWDPPWTQERMSEIAKLELGFL
jgi:FeS assembly SUF system protein